MALIVTNTSPKKLKTTNLSHYEMIRQFVEKLKVGAKLLLSDGITLSLIKFF